MKDKLWTIDIYMDNGVYRSSVVSATFEEACARKERASKKVAFAGRRIEVVEVTA